MDDLIAAIKGYAAISAWARMGLFDALRNGPLPLKDLPGDLRAKRATLPLLRHLGLIVGNVDVVALSDVGRELLENRQLPTDHEKFFDTLSRTHEILEHGGPARDRAGNSLATTGGVSPDKKEKTRAFLEYLYSRSEKHAERVFEWLSPRLPAAGRVLDLGGGHGRYARAFADRGHPTTLMDLPVVIELARERHGDALSYIAGDFLEGAELGGPWDVVVLSNIAHGQSDEENAALVQRLAGTLAEKGVIAIRDMFLDEHGANPQNAAAFAMTMLMYTHKGESWAIRDVQRWAQRAGLVLHPGIHLDSHSLMILGRG